MASSLPNCWEIKQCGREQGGLKVAELGECVASVEKLGHSCWEIAGTLCGGAVDGTFAEKEGTCLHCEVYRDYNRLWGTKSERVQEAFPDEDERYGELLVIRLSKIYPGSKS